MKDVKKYSVKWTHWDSNRECLKFDKVSKPSSSTIITTYEIQLLIKNLKMKSNSSPNDIPYKFLKIANCIVSEWLSKLFNKCMTTGEFPDSWKIATITPIPKVHSPRSPSEYRPISVLPVLSKLFEKVLYHRVYSYLTERNLIDKRQYGFRENHSTELFNNSYSTTSCTKGKNSTIKSLWNSIQT